MKTIILSFLLSLSACATFASNPTERILKILNTGDGKTAKTAYKVYSIQEEYDILEYLKLQPQMHILKIIDDQYYDVFIVGYKQVYFQFIPKSKSPNA